MTTNKIIRSSTVGESLNDFCYGILSELKQQGYDVVAVSSPDKHLQTLAKREVVRTIGVPMERHISLWKDLVSLWQMTRVFMKEKPDMVHSMTPKAGLLCMIAAWLTRVPVRVHTFTGLVWPTSTGLQRRVLMLTDKITCACATHVIPEGQGVLNDLSAHITSKPMKVLGYGNVRGIDLSYWSKSEEIGVRSEKLGVLAPDGKKVFTFLFVGRLVGDKGINELVSAFAKLGVRSKDLGIHCRLVLVGPYEDNLDPVSAETRTMIDKLPEIQAVGSMYGEDLLAWYAAADCFVFPSYREGFPNTVIEAGAMELPCIVTDINGSREIIGPPHTPLQSDVNMRICGNGIVIPSKNADALYDAMQWMLEHEEERLAMGKTARTRVAERYEQGYVREQLYAFYRSVLTIR